MRNWTIKDAVEAINKNDADAIKEISKHFPMFFLAIARNDLQALAAMMPEKFTVRRLVMVDTADVDTDGEEANETDNEAEDDAGDADLSTMSTKELMKLCDKRGIKVPHYGKNKQFYLDALNGGSDSDSDDERGTDDDDDATDPYEGKTAMELFKECKKRGIKVEPKQKASAYAKLLKAADAEDGDVEGNDDDWGDEAEEEKPAKTDKKSGTKSNKKDEPATKTDDDDDEWDI